MTMHFVTTERAYGRSGQTRADWPEGEAELHPRAAEMAEVIRDVGPGCDFRDLMQHGFTAAEVAEFGADAVCAAKERWTKQATMRPDMVADIIAKARAPMPNAPPLTRDMKETQALLVLWGNYCMACAAFKLDPWSAQRKRAIDKLSTYLDRMPIFPRIRVDILNAVAGHMPQVSE